MNNLLLLTLAGSVGLALYCTSQSLTANILSQNANAQTKLKDAAAEAARGRAEFRRVEKLFISQKENVQRLRTDFNVLSAKEAAKTEDLTDLNPEKEGFWPADKPYFYLSKKRLAGLSYWPFNDGAGTLSKQAVMLFGMSREEENAANAAYVKARAKIQALEKSGAIATNSPGNVAKLSGTKTTYVIPAFPREAADAINQEFKAALTEELGPIRASLLGQRIDEVFEASPYAITKTRTLTLVRNGDYIHLMESDGHGNITSSSTTDNDGRHVIPHHVRHLFEE